MTDESSDNKGISRRRFIGAAAGLSGAAVLGAVAGVRLDGNDDNHPRTDQLSNERLPFRGIHQAGISNRCPASAIMASFDVVAQNHDDLIEVFKTLTNEIEPLTKSIPLKEKGPEFAPHDNLVNGVTHRADALTVTVGVGSSLFDNRFGLTDRKPKHLEKMPHFPNDRLDPDRTHGDLAIQICAEHAESCLRALRIMMKATRSTLVLRWLEQGFVQPNTLGPGRTSTRNLLGFKDGTVNGDSSDNKRLNEFVWVNAHDDEPDWTAGGSYMVTRSIRMLVEDWDRTSLDEQENIIGRAKESGAPLGSKKENDTPVFYSHPHQGQIPVNAHIRLANPHTKATDKNKILRRGFNYSRGFDEAGQLNQGLLFICYQRNLEDGFLAIQARLNGEPLEEYVEPNGGGFFFMLPGVSERGYIGAQLFA